MFIRVAAALAVMLFAILPSHAMEDPFTYAWQEVAPGVWTGIRENSPRIPVMGTTTFVVGETGVVVFDGGGITLMSERAIEKIRSVTAKPVTYVVVSHWHQDHNYGLKAFIDAFPGVNIVSHAYTRDALIRSNATDLDQTRAAVEALVPTINEYLGKNAFPDGTALTATDRARYRQFLDDAPLIDREYKRIDPVYPNLTFDESFTIYLGNRTVELKRLGNSNTAGDIVMWLPEEKILASGDIVVRPTPYGFGSYPREWAESLRKIKALNYALLIPGHGDLQRDAAYVDLLIETFDLIAEQMAALVAAGLSEEEAVQKVDFSSVEPRFTGGDPFLAIRFNVWFKQPIAQAAYRVEKGDSPEIIQ